jgi:hypothetical protein
MEEQLDRVVSPPTPAGAVRRAGAGPKVVTQRIGHPLGRRGVLSRERRATCLPRLS